MCDTVVLVKHYPGRVTGTYENASLYRAAGKTAGRDSDLKVNLDMLYSHLFRGKFCKTVRCGLKLPAGPRRVDNRVMWTRLNESQGQGIIWPGPYGFGNLRVLVHFHTQKVEHHMTQCDVLPLILKSQSPKLRYAWREYPWVTICSTGRWLSLERCEKQVSRRHRSL